MKRSDIKRFRDIPNIGAAIEKKLYSLGMEKPSELSGKDPYQLYDDLCLITNKKLDPCVLDILISAVEYMEGAPAKKWWEFTAERKKHSKKNT